MIPPNIVRIVGELEGQVESYTPGGLWRACSALSRGILAFSLVLHSVASQLIFVNSHAMGD